MIENELKYLLTLEEYNNISCELGNCFSFKKYIQVNYYYDTVDCILDKNDITLRVRQKESDLKMQYKCPIKQEGILSVKNEITKDMKGLPLTIDINECEWNAIIPYNCETSIKGALITERTEYRYNDCIEIDLDKNYYLGLVDYELEIEFRGEYEEIAFKIISDLIEGSIIPKDIRNKRSRFFKELKQMVDKKIQL